MNIADIKAAVDDGKTVQWANEGYVVHKDAVCQYLIVFTRNGSTIGLTNRDGSLLNGDEAEFFVSRPDLGLTIHCAACGSEDVMEDAWAVWDPELQFWEAADLQDHAYCNTCDGETRLVDRPVREYATAPEGAGTGNIQKRPVQALEQGGGT